MKALLITLLLVFPAVSQAASPEQDYLAARNAAVRKVAQSEKRKDSEEIQTKLHDAALADLEKRLRPIVGAVEVKGFSAIGKSNLSALSQGDIGYGALDAMVFRAADEKSSVMVTTTGLLKNWIKEHRNWWPGLENVPQDVEKVLQSDAFYTQALDSDAAYSRYVELPVASPAGGFSFAVLGSRAQDIGPRAPDQIIVAAIRGSRVFLVSAPASVTIEQVAACQPVWDEAVRKARAASEKYVAGGRKDERLATLSTKIENDGDAAYRACSGERIKADARFSTLTAQAQALLDALPPK